MTRDAQQELRLDLSGLLIRVRGLPAGCTRQLQDDWNAFIGGSTESPPLLDVRVRVEGGRRSGGPFSAKDMRASFDGGSARFTMDEGSIQVDDAGMAEVMLLADDESVQLYALLNLLLPALAWLLSARQAGILHAAGIVLDGCAFVMVGPEGSGKSTWVGLARSGGATPLSDDVIFVDASGESVEVLGSPYRTRDFGSTGPGRWPLAAVLFPRHGGAARLDQVTSTVARARLVANLPWVFEAIDRQQGISRFVDRLVDEVPVRALSFPQNPSFLSLLRELSRGGG